MGYPYCGSEFSEGEILQLYKNGEISSDEAKNLERVNGYDPSPVYDEIEED